MYSKKFKSERYGPVQGILDQMQSLEAGGSVRVKGLTVEMRQRAKYLIYDWLHHMALKRLYRIRDIDQVLFISRMDLPPHSIEVEESPLTKIQEEILSSLLMRDESVVDQMLQELLEQEEISEADKEVIKTRWLKVMT